MLRRISVTLCTAFAGVTVAAACAGKPVSTPPARATAASSVPTHTPVQGTGEAGASEPTATPAPTPGAPSEPPTSVGLEVVAEGLNSPVVVTSAGDNSGRLFIVDRIGLIKILSSDGELLEQPFLDLRHKLVGLQGQYDERGLLGFAFHPQYAENGRFFVYYSAPADEDAPASWDHSAHISEFVVSATDPNRADSGSERIVLRVHEPQSNHDGGQVLFGPEGYLYISLGDGGAGNDVGLGHPPIGNGQDFTTLLGSILRIDVDNGDPYAIPPDNPFVGKEGRDEIFAYGLRNPWRMSFDAGGEHELFAADVGQNLWEEVDIVTKGANYGWNTKEGTHCFDPNNPDQSPDECPETGAHGERLIEPITEYGHPSLPGGLGTCVVGGFVYRGNAIPGLQGSYVFGDWTTAWDSADGMIFVATRPQSEGHLWQIRELSIATSDDARLNAYVLAFGQDAELELYVLTTESTGPTGTTGKVWKMVPAE
ncbi:MAG TPA: PQQ-dependent sugar dehydrogenase [Anaerolineae bacterium]|nr:PQQ-dependent sugar dehydrogenase [Anaerolineae bacterium]